MTFYCQSAWKLKDDVDEKVLLTLFAKEHFKALEAVQIDTYQYGVDNGLNDLRAVLKPELNLITFCCRYEKDVQRIETIIRQFAVEHGLQLGLFDSNLRNRIIKP